MAATMSAEDCVLHFASALLPGGWATDVRIGVRDGLVATIAVDTPAANGDECHAVALAGLPNLHSHAFQRGMAGLAEVRGDRTDSFWTWREIMYRFVERLTPDDLLAIAALAYAEMLESGFTRVGEFHYLHHDRDGIPFADPATMSAAIITAAREAGIALTHLPVFYAHAGFGGTAPGEEQRRFVHDLDGFARLLDAVRSAAADLPDAVVGIAPHSLRAVTPDELRVLETLAGDEPIHIHVAEQMREVEDCLAWSGTRPIDWLLDHTQLDTRWCLVHATHMTDRESRRLIASGAAVGLCPITEANLGDGLFPIEAFLEADGRYGVGSDSNVRIDATEELRLLEYGQRLTRRERNLMAAAGASTGGTLYRSALAGGSQALGVEGGIRIGGAADLVSLDADHPAFFAREGDALLDGWVFAAGREAIDCVWRRGRRIVSEGRHIHREAIRARYRTTLMRLLG